MTNKTIHTSKGWFSADELDKMRGKVYNVTPIKSKVQLQSMCDKFAKYLKENNYKIEVSNFNKGSVRIQPLSYSDTNEPYCRYSGVEKSFSFNKVNCEWLTNQIWLEYTLFVDGYAQFFCFSDTSPDDIVAMPTDDAIAFLRLRDDLVKLSCILNSYKIPSQYFLDNTFYDCLKKSWNKLGKHIINIDCRS